MPRPTKNLTLTEDETRTWLHRITQAEARNKRWREDTAAYRKAYHAEFPKPYPDEDEEEQVVVNRVKRIVTQWKSTMYAQNPQVVLDPPWTPSQEEEKKADLNAAIYNLELRRVGLEGPMKRAIQTACLDGWAFLRCGFHAEFEEDVTEHEEEVSTNAEDENYAFGLTPDLYPQEVLLHEDHEDHEARHRIKAEQISGQLKELEALAQKSQQQALQQGVDPSEAILPELAQEIQRLRIAQQAIEEHRAEHRDMAAKRDREGLFPTDLRIQSESCWVDYVHNTNVVWDQNATGPHNWSWVAERIIKPAEELREKEWFKARAEEITANFPEPVPGAADPDQDDNYDGAPSVRSEVLGEGFEGADEPDALAFMWKVWDSKNRRIIYFHDNMETPAKVIAWPHRFLKAPPFRMLAFVLREDEFRPVSPIKYLWDQQQEINRYRTKAGLITRRSARQAIADPRLAPDFIAEVEQGNDGAIHQPESVSVDISKAFHVIEWGQVPVDVHQNAAIADQDIARDTGLGQTLNPPTKEQTATETVTHQGNIDVMMDEMLREIEDCVAGLTVYLRALMRQYYKQERYAEWFDGVEKKNATWRGTDLADYGIRVEMGSSRRQDEQIERMQWMEFFKLTAQYPGINARAVINEILRRMGVTDVEAYWVDQGAPDAAQQQAMIAQGGAPGPGQGQNQTSKPAGPQTAAAAQPGMDMTKVG